MTLKEVEALLLKHLNESQEIRDKLTDHGNDLKWIKRIGYFIVGYLPISEAVRHLWR